MRFNSMAEQAQFYACNAHRQCNQLYDHHPYEFHLNMVVECAKEWLHLLPKEYHDVALAICWTHDVIEDARQTYNDVKAATNEYVAEGAYALTQEKGRTRHDRESDAYFDGIAADQVFTFCKFCDRMANTRYSKTTGSGMFAKYSKDMPAFLARLSAGSKGLEPMVGHLMELATPWARAEA